LCRPASGPSAEGRRLSPDLQHGYSAPKRAPFCRLTCTAAARPGQIWSASCASMSVLAFF
jgi:hypothetical protein